MTRIARPARTVATEAELLAVEPAIRRFAEARIAASPVPPGALPAEADDIVQEVLVRLWDARWRLEGGTLLAYGLVVARNLVTSAERSVEISDRYRPRLVESLTDDDPALAVLAAEEHAALDRGLAALGAADRHLLVEHEVHDVDTHKLAAEGGVSANTIAARLARGRARLRVDHLLALRRVTLPTARCRGVLDALSLGDRHRQHRLGAAGHLVDCATCAGLVEPLVTRRRSLTALAPLTILLIVLPRRLADWVRTNPATAATSAGVGAVAVATAVALATAGEPAPPPVAAAGASPEAPVTLSVGGTRILPASRVPSLADAVGRAATARGVPVESVPADEGFWVGAGPGRRVWVQLRSSGESTVRVRPGHRATFTGRVVKADPGTPARVGLSAAEGAAELTAAGAYVLVPVDDLTVG